MDKEKFVEEHYQTMKVAEIAKILETSESNVKRIARKLGISKFKSVKWTEAEIYFLEIYYPTHKGKWCAEHLERGFHAVHKKAKELGLKPNWKHVSEDSQGYLVDISDRSNKRYVHRKVMEEVLGRPLRSDEIVHHIDGNKKNNNPSNLQIVTRAEHIRIHKDDLMKGK